MKRLSRIAKGAILALTAAGMLAGCVSKSETVENMAEKMGVVDWANRAMGIDLQPSWLKAMLNGNSNEFKTAFGIDENRVVKPSRASGRTEAVAQALSRAGFAYGQAAELRQKLIGRIGEAINSNQQLEAVYKSATETKAEMTGLREETTFWQKYRTKDPNGKDIEEYVYYTIYSMDKDTWDQICKNYLMDVMGAPELETETQQKIGELFTEMKTDADKKDAAQAEAERKAYEAQMARLELEKAKIDASVQRSEAEAEKAQAVARAMALEAMLK